MSLRQLHIDTAGGAPKPIYASFEEQYSVARTCARMGNWGLAPLGLPGSSSSKAFVSCMMLVPAWRKLWLRRDALAGDSRSRITS